MKTALYNLSALFLIVVLDSKAHACQLDIIAHQNHSFQTIEVEAKTLLGAHNSLPDLHAHRTDALSGHTIQHYTFYMMPPYCARLSSIILRYECKYTNAATPNNKSEEFSARKVDLWSYQVDVKNRCPD